MDRKAILTFVAVIGVVLLAAGFRFYDIQNYPPGLFPDQAANGEDVLLILDGDARPFYPRGNGREALFFYLQAAFVKLFGIGVWPMFAASATVGIFTVLATFFATRVYFGRLAGLLAAFFLATSHWHVTLSRTGFRAILIPLFVALFTAFVGYTVRAASRGKTTQSYIFAALAGVSFFGGFYTYIAYRIMVGVVLGVLFIMLLAALHPSIGFPHLRRYRLQLLAGLLAGLVVTAPLGRYFVQHPDAFVGRAGQVSIFNPDLQREFGGGKVLPTFIYALRTTLLAFFVGEGDLNWRHNVAGYPLLNALVGLLVLLGLAWVLQSVVTLFYKMMRGVELHQSFIVAYLLLLLLGMLVPVVTTAQGLPHGLRSIGLVVPLFMLAGVTGSVCIYWLKRRTRTPAVRAVIVGGLLGSATISALYDGALYFLIARNDSDAYYAYRGDLTVVSGFLNTYHREHPDEARPYLVLDSFSLQTVHFLTTVTAHDHVVGETQHPDVDRHRWHQLNPATSHLTPLQPGDVIVFTQSTLPDADRFKQHHQTVEVVTSTTNRFGQEIMRIYQQPDNTPSPESPGGNSLDA